jgi:alanyl-tRNA synthetase
VFLLPDPRSASLRIGVAVPAPAADAGRLDARAVLRQVLSVTGGRGGGSPVFAQGGGTEPADPQQVLARVRAALGLEEEPAHAG